MTIPISDLADYDTSFPLLVGAQVGKNKGYAFPSTVVSVFLNLAGDYRVVCESSQIPGLLHIFAPGQLYRRYQEDVK